MFIQEQEKTHIAIIMVEGKYNDLYPLSEGYSVANFPVGNKKLITFQLQELQAISSISKIFIIYNQSNAKVRQYLQKEFIPKFPHYPHPIQFYRVDGAQRSFTSLQQFVESETFESSTKFQNFKGAIIMPIDTINSFKLKSVLDFHCEKKADLTFLLKQKKEFTQGQKKPQIELESEVDIGLIGSEGELIYLDMIEQYQQNGFKLSPTLYHKIKKGTFKKVIDSQIYFFSSNLLEIVKNLKHEDITKIKPDFVNCVVRNQTNTNLLKVIKENNKTPLKIYTKIAGPDDYIRRITQIKILEQVNFDSLIKGNKQKQVLVANEFTQSLDPKYNTQYKGTLIGGQCLIDNTCKIQRSCIQNGCKIGKNVQIFKSIILSNCVIEDGCKISESVIGPNCIIRQECTLLECNAAAGCVIDIRNQGKKLQKQQFIPND